MKLTTCPPRCACASRRTSVLILSTRTDSRSWIARALAEEGVQGAAPHAVRVVVHGLQQRAAEEAVVRGVQGPRVALALVLVAAGVDLVQVRRVVDVDVDRVDAHDGAVLLVQLLDLPQVPGLVRPEVVVELIPEADGGELGARELGQRVQGDAVHIDEGPVFQVCRDHGQQDIAGYDVALDRRDDRAHVHVSV